MSETRKENALPGNPPRMPGAGQRRYDQTRSFCDLVMQGGITSGVVYPMAALELATVYTFRGIGGSSAGAIAAAAVAAAEHGRDQGGFDRLEQLCNDLGTEGKLLSLFQPRDPARPMFDVIRGYLDFQRLGGTIGGWITRLITGLIASTFWTAFFLTVLAGGLLFAAGYLPGEYQPAWWFGLPIWVHVVLPILFGVTSFVVVLAWKGWSLWNRVRTALGDLEANHFGLCTGLGTQNTGEALTDYLTSHLNLLAALPPEKGPLTFAHLHQKRENQPIDLLIMTSDLSLRRPVRFPLENELLIAQESEWRAMFPASVVDHLRAHPPKDVPGPLPNGFFYLPQGRELPVIVAVRISLSFPLLFSAVPLYTLSDQFHNRRQSEPNTIPQVSDLKRNYFSDGGIVSNFPIHLFDRWLPDCPTFGINLAELPPQAFDRPADCDPGAAECPIRPDYLSVVQTNGTERPAAGLEPVHLPNANERLVLEWYAIDTLVDLLSGIFFTAKNHRDTLQAMLPSYRERIITIRLAEDEGGLNLNMSRDKIEAIMKRGQEAGITLREDFNFDHHRWVRFQVILAQLELELEQMTTALEQSDWWTQIDHTVGAEYPFHRDPEWCRQSTVLIREMLTLLKNLRQDSPSHFNDGHGPTPSPVKRLVPPE